MAMMAGDVSEEQDYDTAAVVGVPGEGLVHSPVARLLALVKVQHEATGWGVSVRMDWTVGDVAQAEDTARRSPRVIAPFAGQSRLEEQQLHSRMAVIAGAAVEEHAVQSAAVREFPAIATGKTLDARPWDSQKRQARRSVVVSAAHAEDNPADQSLEGMSW